MDEQVKALALFSSIYSEFSTILIGYRATLEKVDQLGSVKWYDEAANRWTNKHRMKEVGGAMMSYQRFLYESSVMNVANSIERTCIWLKQDFKIKWDVFKNSSTHARFQDSAREFRALANIIKHNSAYIDHSTSEFAKYLVEERGFPDKVTIDLLSLSTPRFHYAFEPNACRAFVFCVEILAELTCVNNPFCNLPDDKVSDSIPKLLIPDVLQLKSPID